MKPGYKDRAEHFPSSEKWVVRNGWPLTHCVNMTEAAKRQSEVRGVARAAIEINILLTVIFAMAEK
jgi:hypothetical protein